MLRLGVLGATRLEIKHFQGRHQQATEKLGGESCNLPKVKGGDYMDIYIYIGARGSPMRRWGGIDCGCPRVPHAGTASLMRPLRHYLCGSQCVPGRKGCGSSVTQNPVIVAM